MNAKNEIDSYYQGWERRTTADKIGPKRTAAHSPWNDAASSVRILQSLLLEIVFATTNYGYFKSLGQMRSKRNAVLKGRFDKLLTLLDSVTDMVSKVLRYELKTCYLIRNPYTLNLRKQE